MAMFQHVMHTKYFSMSEARLEAHRPHFGGTILGLITCLLYLASRR